MIAFDVRFVNDEKITKIVFADEDEVWTTAVSLVREGSTVIGVQSEYEKYVSYKIVNKEHALNLIKALNKAIDLGWLV